jgi:acetyl-CoA C-acetyltransferase
MILAEGDIAKNITPIPIWVVGLGSASDTGVSGREAFTGLKVARIAAKQAYEMAGVGPQDIDVAEVHDCFTIAEMMAYEDLGFAKPGEGPRLIDEKQTYIGGKIPVNIDGGLLCKGHPVGATGGSQIRTLVKQLRGEMGETQIKDAEIALGHNVGGIGHYCDVTILRR